MPDTFTMDQAPLVNGPMLSNVLRLKLDMASIVAFREMVPDTDANAAARAPARRFLPHKSDHRAAPPEPAAIGEQRVAYTGVVRMSNGTVYLCPLVPARAAGKYQGPLLYGKRNLTPIDHYSGAALTHMAGPDVAAQVFPAMQQNQRVLLGQTRPTIGSHRVPGIAASESVAGARSMAPTRTHVNPLTGTASTVQYRDSAAHQILVKRLGEQPEGYVGFAVEKNALGAGVHQVMFVSSLNIPHFGVRGMTHQFAAAIVHALQRAFTQGAHQQIPAAPPPGHHQPLPLAPPAGGNDFGFPPPPQAGNHPPPAGHHQRIPSRPLPQLPPRR